MGLLEKLGLPRLSTVEEVLRRCNEDSVDCWRPLKGLDVAHFVAVHAGTSAGQVPVRRVYLNRRMQSYRIRRRLMDGANRVAVEDDEWVVPACGDRAVEATAVVDSIEGEFLTVNGGHAQGLLEMMLASEPPSDLRHSGIAYNQGASSCPCCSQPYPAL